MFSIEISLGVADRESQKGSGNNSCPLNEQSGDRTSDV